MKRFKRTVTMLLAASLLMCAACGHKNVAEEETVTSQSEAPTVSSEETTEQSETNTTTESADDIPEQDNGRSTFKMKFKDETDSGSIFMRFDYYLGDEPQGMMSVCPDEGEDGITLSFDKSSMYTYQSPEDLENFRIECYLGYSDELSAEEAVLASYDGTGVDMTYVGELTPSPEFGDYFEYTIRPDASSETGYSLVAE